ncbi:RNA-dependent RNA polymerase [Heterobasidion partitivirus 13]|uniref:RNA-dependent RNA polymerase n=1 Tax=Heterobasidion partitivirus 13 TaxID=1469906 RepID=W8PA42_9VIRU|nr:RNA-dependent RNA polymerase [Heterobasidion partitivirus 13]AHL25153.1 RNA-dependent RNA polymerase [Heterobasidion partitivirus 13]UNA06822.1 RNA-dependent RNA polymerase [Heterobasidion partitivirus 13]
MLPIISQVTDYVYRKFIKPAPTQFKNNYLFQNWLSPLTTPHRDATKYAEYQAYLEKHIRSNLLGSDAEYVIKRFHHPIATIDSVNETLQRGDLPDHPVPKDEHYYRALTETTKRFAPPQLIRPIHFADLRYYEWNWHPNVEEPYVSNSQLKTAVQDAYHAGLLEDGRMSFGNLKNHVFMDVRHFLHRIKRGQISDPHTLWPLINMHVKPALTETDTTKIRLVFGVSKRHVLPRAMFFWPLFRYYLDNRDKSPMLWGFETILGGMMLLNSEMLLSRLYYQTFVTVDWSGFDLRSLFSIIREDIFPAWRTYFDFNNGYMPTKFYKSSTADPDQLERLWNWTNEAVFKMPFRTMDGATFLRLFRGIPSGLFETQFLDSFYNMLMILTILDAMGFDISTIYIRVQGDDSLLLLTFFLPADQHAEFKAQFEALAAYYFDHVARQDKTDISNTSQNVAVLGYSNDNGYPSRDWRKLLAQLFHPRSQRPTLSLLKARCCGIQYASMYKYPQVTNVAKATFNQLDSEGVQPVKLAAQRDVILHSHKDFYVPTDHFPTLNEVTRYLRIPYTRTEADSETYYPMSHFLSQF